MKKILLVLFIAGCFTFQMYAESLADEKKTITPKEFATTISEVPNKVGNFLTNEVEKTKEYTKEKLGRNRKQNGHLQCSKVKNNER